MRRRGEARSDLLAAGAKAADEVGGDGGLLFTSQVVQQLAGVVSFIRPCGETVSDAQRWSAGRVGVPGSAGQHCWWGVEAFRRALGRLVGAAQRSESMEGIIGAWLQRPNVRAAIMVRPPGGKKAPAHSSRLNGPLELFTVATRLNRASSLPCTSPASRTLTAGMTLGRDASLAGGCKCD